MKTGRQWAVFKGEELIEGGFFNRGPAEDCAERLRAEDEQNS